MGDYAKLFQTQWRGWSNSRSTTSYEEQMIIIESKANSYDEFVAEFRKKNEALLAEVGGKPFYEPSTYYYNYKEAHRHNNPHHAAMRQASNLLSKLSRYRAHRAQGPRTIPEERDEYELKLWRISHPTPLTPLEKDLWATINQVSATEPWAWPMMIGLYREYNKPQWSECVPVTQDVKKVFCALGYSEEEFAATQTALWLMLEWDSSRHF